MQHLNEAEGKVYATKLASLQDSVVPKCYGVFHGQDPWNDDVTCLLLKDAGKEYADEFCTLPDESKALILNMT